MKVLFRRRWWQCTHKLSLLSYDWQKVHVNVELLKETDVWFTETTASQIRTQLMKNTSWHFQVTHFAGCWRRDCLCHVPPWRPAFRLREVTAELLRCCGFENTFEKRCKRWNTRINAQGNRRNTTSTMAWTIFRESIQVCNFFSWCGREERFRDPTAWHFRCEFYV